MRAISLHQPHASAVELLAKRNETRGWATGYRGPLLIHAARRCVARELEAYRRMECWRAALAGTQLIEQEKPEFRTCLPFGALLCVCDVTDCRPVESLSLADLRTPRSRLRPDGSTLSWTEEDMGGYGPGRFAWTLENVRSLSVPVPWKGCQNFFDVPAWAFEKSLPDAMRPSALGAPTHVPSKRRPADSVQRELFP